MRETQLTFPELGLNCGHTWHPRAVVALLLAGLIPEGSEKPWVDAVLDRRDSAQFRWH